MHARAAGRFLQVEHVLAQVEGVKEAGNRAEIDAAGAQPDAMRRDARQLGDEHADLLRARGNAIGDAEQFLDAEHVAEPVALGREIIHALDDGLRLRPKKILGGLFDAGVQVADLGLGRDDGLAVYFEHDLQHAVRRGMLRAHRQHHRIAVAADDLRRERRGRQRHGEAPSSRTRAICSCNASSVRPVGGVPACTLLLSANGGRGAFSRAGPRSG